jgi:SAM-dependent methyltransferase
MAQIAAGLRGLLAFPQVYDAFKGSLVGSSYRAFFRDYVRARPRDRVLDIGCGTGDIVGYLPPVDYVGFDDNPRYVAAATRRWGGGTARFHCQRVDTATCEPAAFDLVLALGVLHHLDDEPARTLFGLAHQALRSGGRLVTFDGCYVEGQSRMARFLVSRDRGRNVRTVEGYRHLAAGIFARVHAHVRHELIRVPYTHLILECERE